MIATLNNTTMNTATATLTDTLDTLFAELNLHSSGQTDLVIDQMDQWKNPDLFAENCFSSSCVTWALGVETTQR